MDNHLPIREGRYAGQGPLHHLHYYLHQTTHIPGLYRPIASQVHAYFSLKHAVCRLITADIDKLDPQVAQAKGLPYFQSLAIQKPNRAGTLGELVFNRPGHAVIDDAPGIYLRTNVDISTLRKITSLSLPAGQQLDGPYRLKLADYNSEFDNISPTSIYQQIQAEARAFLQADEHLNKDAYCQLVFKGEYLSAGISKKERHDSPDGGPDKRRSYLEHHYFPDVGQALRHLLSTDPALFDEFCPDNTTEQFHHFGYILDSDKAVAAFINVISIHDAPDGLPVAGIYLHTEELISLLEKAAELNLSAAFSYDAEMPFLLLAEYSYDNGYRMTIDEGVETIRARLQYPREAYCTVTRYEFADAVSYPEVRAGVEFHHDQQLSTAIQRLLHAELPLLLEPAKLNPSGVCIREAAITAEDGEQVASLCVVASQPTLAGYQTICLRLETGMVQFLSTAGIAAEIDQVINPYDIELQAPTARLVPIAFTDQSGEVIPLNDNIAYIQNLFTGPAAGLPQAVDAQLSTQPAAGASPYMVLLNWSALIPIESGSAQTFHIPFADINDAHDLMLAIEPDNFIPTTPNNTSKPYLTSARLLDTTSMHIVASRHYRTSPTELLAAGHYLQYNQDHQMGAQLARQSQASAVSVTEASPGTDLITLRQLPSVRQQRQRSQIPGNGKGHRL